MTIFGIHLVDMIKIAIVSRFATISRLRGQYDGNKNCSCVSHNNIYSEVVGNSTV